MSALSVTPSLPAMTCTITLSGAPAGTPVTLWRSDINGVRAVRLPAGAVTDGAGGYVATDHEAALVGNIAYSSDQVTWSSGAEQRRNYARNPAAQTTAAYSDGSGAAGTVARLTGAGMGQHDTALRRTITAAGSNNEVKVSSGAPTLTPGVWSCSALVRSSTAGTVKLFLAWFNASGGYIGGDFGHPGTAAAAGAAVRLTRDNVTVPAGAAQLQVIAQYAGAVAVGHMLDLTDVLIERAGATGGYFDGDTPAPAGLLYSWAGTPGDSESIASATVTLADPSRPPGVYLHAAADPTRALGPLTLIGRRLSTDTGAQLHVVMGRADQVDTGTAARLRAGDIEFLHDGWADARSLESLIVPRPSIADPAAAPRRALMLRQQEWDGMDGLYRVARVQLERTAGRKWVTTLSVDEAWVGPALMVTP